MFHLVKDTTTQIENNLLWVKSVRDSMFSMWFNIVLLVCVVGSFAYFLYANHGTATPPELQKVREAIRVASDALIIKGKRKEAAQAPSEILSETRISLEEVVMQFAEVSKLPGFDPKRFEFHLKKVHKSLEDLTKEYEKFQAKD